MIMEEGQGTYFIIKIEGLLSVVIPLLAVVNQVSF